MHSSSYLNLRPQWLSDSFNMTVLNVTIFAKVEFEAELLCWTALDFTGINNKLATECKNTGLEGFFLEMMTHSVILSQTDSKSSI